MKKIVGASDRLIEFHIWRSDFAKGGPEVAMAAFKRAKIERHIRKYYPSCPDFAVSHVAELVVSRPWWDMTPSAAVVLTMESVLRHNMTEYEALLRDGVDRETARLQVEWKVEHLLSVWRKKRDC